jgi:hypothetical protein
MRRTLHAFRNYAKHAHEDRTFRVALAVAAAILAVVAIAYKPADVVVLEGRTCRPWSKFYVVCPLPPTPGNEATIGTKR